MTGRSIQDQIKLNPFGSSHGEGDEYPIYYVNYNEICAADTGFLAKLNAETGKSYTLPTEAQWEFAAAGGNDGYNADDSRKHVFSGSNTLSDVGWYGYEDNNALGNSGDTTHPVGTLSPNELGIHDMSGNVWELCSDWYGKTYYESSPDTNPPGPESGSERVVRGGAYDQYHKFARVSYRYSRSETSRASDSGFRLASNSDPTGTASASAATKPKIEVTVEVQVIKD